MMMKLIKKISARMSRFLLLTLATAQLLLLSSSTVPDFYDDLLRKYTDYSTQFPPVKLTLITHQPAYVPGDTIFFQAWYTYEDLTPVKGNHLITLELLDDQGERMKKIRFKVTDGKGSNQFILPAEIKPGLPMLAGYSDWMKNFNDRLFFRKPLKIVTATTDVQITSQETPITFHPEGGVLIRGVQTKVGVKGPPRSVLRIQNQHQQLVAQVVLDSTGIGFFLLLPDQQADYSAEHRGKTFSLPPVMHDGVGLTLQEESRISVWLQRPEESMYSKEEVLAVVIRQGKVVMEKRIRFDDKRSIELTLPEFNDPGYHILYLFNPRGEVLAERILVTPSAKGLTSKVSVAGEQTRKPVSVTVQQPDGPAQVNSAEFAMSVWQSSLFPDYHPQDVFSFVDLPETLLRLETYGTSAMDSINQFLMTQQWTRIYWPGILNTQPPAINYPFRSTLSLKGNVIQTATGESATDSLTLLTYLMNNTMGYETTVRNGQFSITYMNDFFGDDEAFIGFQQGNKILDQHYSIRLSEEQPPLHYRAYVSVQNSESPYGVYAARKKIIDQSYGLFQNGNTLHINAIGEGTAFEQEYGGADYTVNLNDYLVFNSMKDMIHEVIPFVQYREKNAVPAVRVMFRNSNGSRIYDPYPLYVIDGYFTRNTRLFRELAPADLLQVKIINNPGKLARMGLIGRNGVILITSKKGDLGKILEQQNHIPLVGLSRAVTATSQSLPPGTVPYTRASLYWNSQVNLSSGSSATYTFQATDDTGIMNIFLIGLTSDHQPFTARTEFPVYYKP
jgi:hypothetical protein